MIDAVYNTIGSLALFADTVRTTFSWNRIHENSDWILPVAVLFVVMIFVRKWYEKDAHELGRKIGWFLTILRTLAFVGLFVLYLQPQWRTETERRIESRAAILVDTSLSMALTDYKEGALTEDELLARGDQVAKLLGETDLLERLRKTHHVDVYTFGGELHQVATLEKLCPTEEEQSGASSDGKDDPDGADNGKEKTEASASEESLQKPLDWNELLKPKDTETRLGDALAQLLGEVRDVPISGIVIMTDGRQNTGSDPVTAVTTAAEAKIRLLPIGVGSDTLPPSVRVSRFAVPPRAQPGDRYTVTGYVQAKKMKGKTVKVELLRKGANPNEEPVLIEEREVTLGPDGETLPVQFEMLPTEAGRQSFLFRVVAPKEDRHQADNVAEAQIEIIDRPLRVLLFAGGPMREYRFLRNLLHRDKGVEVDVLLQSAREGVSQDANRVLDVFPETAEELFSYDCIVAFDPDWRMLTDPQFEMLEHWVAEQGGGMILFAGAVSLGDSLDGWVQDDRTASIRALYPVIFERRYVTDITEKAGEEPWPPAFTREGAEAEFLRLADDPAESEAAWEEFEGVYAYLPVQGPKSSATVYARFADPTVANDQTNIYFAGQFYGSGRTFYAGSAEMWRLRRIGAEHYERFFTKLIRHVAQGRLLRDSARGVLLVEREQYLPGDSVEVRARLSDAQLAPLAAGKVDAEITLPDESTRVFTLMPELSHLGTFVGRFPVTAEGNYQLALTMPDDQSIRLERRFQVKMPDRERENPVRNDALLQHLADSTEGRYYLGTKAAATTGPDSLVAQLPNRTKTIVLASTPDTKWEQTWLMWLMFIVVGLLAIEWIIRRLLKLA